MNNLTAEQNRELQVAKNNGYKGDGCTAEMLVQIGWSCTSPISEVSRGKRDLINKVDNILKEFCLRYGLTRSQVELSNTITGIKCEVKL